MGDVTELRPAGGLDSSGRSGLRFELVRGLRRIFQIEKMGFTEEMGVVNPYPALLDVLDKAERAFNQERANPESLMWMTEASTYQTVLETLFEGYREKAQ